MIGGCALSVLCHCWPSLDADTFARRLELLAPPPAASLRSSVTGTLGNGHRGAAQRTPRRSSVRTAGSELGRQIVDVLSSILSTNAEATCPRSAEARRIISVFLNSLSLDRCANHAAQRLAVVMFTGIELLFSSFSSFSFLPFRVCLVC